MVLPSRLRLLQHVISQRQPAEDRLLALRCLVNLSSSKEVHDDIVNAPGQLPFSLALSLESSQLYVNLTHFLR